MQEGTNVGLGACSTPTPVANRGHSNAAQNMQLLHAEASRKAKRA
jgi:hypothetical protein